MPFPTNGKSFWPSGRGIGRGSAPNSSKGPVKFRGTIGRFVTQPYVGGTLSSALEDATLASSGAETFTGTFASTLAGATLVAVGASTVTGAFATTLEGATLVASGVVIPPALGFSFWLRRTRRF